jgi:hypothetical protein
MVRVCRRSTVLACACVLAFLAATFAGAAVPGAARADTLSPADLQSQKAAIAGVLKQAAQANGAGSTFVDNDAEWFGEYDLQSRGATANMALHVQVTGGFEDEGGVLVVQFPDSDSASQFAGEQPTSSETMIGLHPVTLKESGFVDNFASVDLRFVCGAKKNLVVIGRYSARITSPAMLPTLRDALIELTTKVHEGLVAAGVCSAGTTGTTESPDDVLQSLFGSFLVDVVSFVNGNTTTEARNEADQYSETVGSMVKEALEHGASVRGNSAVDVDQAVLTLKRLAYLAVLTDKTSGKPLFSTLRAPGIQKLISRMTMLEAMNGSATQATDRLLTMLINRDMTVSGGGAD